GTATVPVRAPGTARSTTQPPTSRAVMVAANVQRAAVSVNRPAATSARPRVTPSPRAPTLMTRDVAYRLWTTIAVSAANTPGTTTTARTRGAAVATVSAYPGPSTIGSTTDAAAIPTMPIGA